LAIDAIAGDWAVAEKNSRHDGEYDFLSCGYPRFFRFIIRVKVNQGSSRASADGRLGAEYLQDGQGKDQ
jgi:hypothetical protein